uniref:Uncharacterized protein n=1 Tax=Corethron hystrix TaxID=216773 RepID=A0A7S1BYC5_9STRA|mmetsp:Transcript_670/g.1358  ORF Transcript_670/g.1358 Transcript_670/m.1358 type:complete len:173 (+) Transcript_670:134-652(+)
MASISCSILRTAQRLRPHASLDANFILRRSFFASSTDHTKLVSSAIVHRIADGPLTSYCLVPPDTALDDNFWVRRLCLASLNLENGTVYGAKIVQKGLGSPETVIARLLEEALVDVPGGQVKALASLDGLCKWVSEEIKIGGNEILEDLKEKDERAYGAVEAIATGIPRKVR